MSDVFDGAFARSAEAAARPFAIGVERARAWETPSICSKAPVRGTKVISKHQRFRRFRYTDSAVGARHAAGARKPGEGICVGPCAVAGFGWTASDPSEYAPRRETTTGRRESAGRHAAGLRATRVAAARSHPASGPRPANSKIRFRSPTSSRVRSFLRDDVREGGPTDRCEGRRWPRSKSDLASCAGSPFAITRVIEF